MKKAITNDEEFFLEEQRFFSLPTRIAEVVLGGIIPSSLTVVFLNNYMKNMSSLLAASCLVQILYMLWTLFCLFQYRVTIPMKHNFYKTNFTALAVYCSTAVLFAGVMHFLSGTSISLTVKKIYTYLFFNFKVFHYFAMKYDLPIGNTGSAILVSAVLFLIVFLFPLFVKKEKYLEPDEYEDGEII